MARKDRSTIHRTQISKETRKMGQICAVFLLLLMRSHVDHVSAFATNHDRQSALPQILSWTIPRQEQKTRCYAAPRSDPQDAGSNENDPPRQSSSTYNLGVGKNFPVGSSTTDDANISNTNSTQSTMDDDDEENIHWNVPDHPNSKRNYGQTTESTTETNSPNPNKPKASDNIDARRVRRMVARTEESSTLRGAIWHEEHYSVDNESDKATAPPSKSTFQESYDLSLPANQDGQQKRLIQQPELFYPNIDLSIPHTVYDPSVSRDIIWDLMRWEAHQEAQREPLLVSFLYSSILNHDSLESSLAFLLANKLSSAAMISTQIQSLILDALTNDPSIGRAIRADIMAVRDRDPACTCLPDVLLYFKGFHALQTYRVANAIWKNSNKQALAHYFQSQMSQTFQIDIHPNATLGSGIMLDHGTGIVIGESAHLGHNCSVLHHVTLGGSGKKGVDRHPKVGDGVLLGAGVTVLGNIRIGEGCQVGAGGLVIEDLPPHSVAVGVPVKIIGNFVNVTEQPSIGMNQMINQTYLSEGI